MSPEIPAHPLFELTTSLLDRLRAGPPTAIEPLTGGRNNRTYLVRSKSPATGDEAKWLLKHYFQDAGNGRDRAGTEWDWATFCWNRGVNWGPQPFARESSCHASLFEFLEGRRLRPDELDETDIKQAATFVTEVNQYRSHPTAMLLSTAAEACFSLDEHLACVDRRIQRLTALPATDELEHSLHQFLTDSLIPAWRGITDQLRSRVAAEVLSATLPQQGRCLSPSDFGFHNALKDDEGRLRFFDFEYAGWDDPAKLICDFFWQQQVPVPRKFLPLLTSHFEHLDDKATDGGLPLEIRVEHLFPVYGIKWCCLVLNEFLTEDRRRREFSQATPIAETRRAEQLEHAKQLLRSVNYFL